MELKHLVRTAATKAVQEWCIISALSLSSLDSHNNHLGKNNSSSNSVTDTDINNISDNNLPFVVNVKALAAPPLPFMSRLADNPQDLDDQLGPGLSRVAHFIAVYSCKVCCLVSSTDHSNVLSSFCASQAATLTTRYIWCVSLTLFA
jgi:hypothetical protein